MRAGSYHEKVETPWGKPLTIQNHPGEVVWLDGSQQVTGFVADGGAWRKDGWTQKMSSADPTAGAGQYWSFVDPAFPMAAHADMLWVDGQQLRQVGARAQVVPGTFFVDPGSSRLWLGSDPSGKRVDAAVLDSGLYVNKGSGSVVRGIGLRRFATSLNQYGTLKAFADNMTVENVVVQDTAARGLGVSGAGVTLRNVTVTGAGQLGIGAYQSDGLKVLRSSVTGNNTERFANAPEAGGIKVTASRDGEIRDNDVSGNQANGVWIDNSVIRYTIVGNKVLHNRGHGIFYEVSGAATIADNLVAFNRENGMMLVESNDLQVYNNSIVRNGHRAIELWESDRDATHRTPVYSDSRHPGQPGILWNARNIRIRNNVMASSESGSVTLLGADDATRTTHANVMASTDFNAYLRPSATSTQWLTNWCAYGTAKSMHVFNDTLSFAATFGQESRSFVVQGQAPELSFRNAAAGDYRFADSSKVGEALPADVAAALRVPAGSVLPVGKLTA
jgi:hypothetical protein